MKKKKWRLLAGEFIGLASPRAVVTVFSAGLVFLAVVPVEYLERLPVKCLFREWLIPWILGGECPSAGWLEGCQCPACDITHALANLLKGNFQETWELNKLAFPVLLVVIILILINIRKIFWRSASKNKIGD